MKSTHALEQRHAFEVRWAWEQAWLRVREPLDGSWHQVQAKDAPRSWIKEATERLAERWN